MHTRPAKIQLERRRPEPDESSTMELIKSRWSEQTKAERRVRASLMQAFLYEFVFGPQRSAAA